MGLFGGKKRRTASAIARVVDVHDAPVSRTTAHGSAGTPDWITVKVRVAPADQPEFDSQFRVWGDAVKQVGEGGGGQQTYVLYDPERPHRCEVDRERLTEEFGSPLGYPGERRVLIPSVGEAKDLAKRSVESGATLPPGIEAIVAANRQRSDGMLRAAQERQQAALKARDEWLAQRGTLSPQAAPPARPTIEERLATIDELHKAGALTDDEFRAKRQQIIDTI